MIQQLQYLCMRSCDGLLVICNIKKFPFCKIAKLAWEWFESRIHPKVHNAKKWDTSDIHRLVELCLSFWRLLSNFVVGSRRFGQNNWNFSGNHNNSTSANSICVAKRWQIDQSDVEWSPNSSSFSPFAVVSNFFQAISTHRCGRSNIAQYSSQRT